MLPSTILFDLMGTLVSNPPREEYDEMVDKVRVALGIESPEFHDRWMEVNDHRLLGHFGSSENEVLDIARKFGVEPADDQVRRCVEIRRRAVACWLEPKPGAGDMLQHIADRGIRMALVTDCVFDVPALWSGHPLADYFDAAVFSCIEKFRKPTPHMYETALARLGASPGEAMFIGDGGSGELTGAQSLGIEAVQIEHGEDVSRRVLRVGVEDWKGKRVAGFRGVMEMFP